MKMEAVGQGPDILYLHGWGFQGQIWNRQVEFFRARYRNLVVDYNLAPLPAGLTHETLLEHVTDALLAQLHTLNSKPKAIAAHGLGSFLAYELIERGLDPEFLVLVGGLVRFTNSLEYLSGLPQERVAGMRKALQDDPLQMLRRYHQFALGPAAETPPAEVAQGLPFQAQAFLKLAFDALITHDYGDVVARLPCRVLVVQGGEDRLSPMWQGEMLRKLVRQSVIHLEPEAGHLAMLTHYAAINRRMERFLESTPG